MRINYRFNFKTIIIMEIVPFGKYKDQPVEALAQDKQYIDWLMGQDWFNARYPQLRTVIINNFKEPAETPEHNKMQGKFLNDDFCIAFAKTAFPSDFEDRTYNDLIYKEPCKNRIDKSFEVNGVDVSLQLDIRFKHIDCLPDSKEQHIEIDESRVFQSTWIRIEVKPAVGDDFPAVLRQMRASRSNVLYLSEYTGVGLPKEDFIKFFEASGIRVVFDSEIEV